MDFAILFVYCRVNWFAIKSSKLAGVDIYTIMY